MWTGTFTVVYQPTLRRVTTVRSSRDEQQKDGLEVGRPTVSYFVNPFSTKHILGDI